jgi:hypothetical protein
MSVSTISVSLVLTVVLAAASAPKLLGSASATKERGTPGCLCGTLSLYRQ